MAVFRCVFFFFAYFSKLSITNFLKLGKLDYQFIFVFYRLASRLFYCTSTVTMAANKDIRVPDK